MMLKKPFISSKQALPSGRCLRVFSLILAMLLFNMGSLRAEDGLSLADVHLSVGKTRKVAIQLNNQSAYTAFQLDIILPEGVSLDRTQGVNGISYSGRATSTHTLTVSTLDNGTIRVVAYSSNNQAFKSSPGDLLYLHLICDGEFDGQRQIKLTHILFTDTSIKEHAFQDVTAFCDAQYAQPGDCDDDGEVTINDVIMTINASLGNASAGYNMAAGDVDGDGEITINDVIKIINMTLQN